MSKPSSSHWSVRQEFTQRVSGAALYSSLCKIGLKAGGTMTEQLARLVDYFGDGGAELEECGYCGGRSPADYPDACPYCGTSFAAETPDRSIYPPGPVQPFVAKPEEAPKVIAKPEVAEILTEKMLDRAVEEIRALRREEAANAWRIAYKLTEIYKSDLWKTRRTPEGDVTYKNFEQFTKNEFGFGRKYAQDTMNLAADYTEEQFRTYGPTKLRIVMQAPEKERQKLLGDISAGAGRAQIEEQVRKPKKGKKAKRVAAEPTADTGQITVASIEGRKMARLYAKPSNPKNTDDLRDAVSLKDVPWGYLDMANDVRMYFTILQGPDGKLSMRFDFKRNKS
jgi:hypothetical protein